MTVERADGARRRALGGGMGEEDDGADEFVRTPLGELDEQLEWLPVVGVRQSFALSHAGRTPKRKGRDIPPMAKSAAPQYLELR
jgi:hypothetical protein